MSLFNPFWETEEPVLVNELGIKWWLDKEMTKICKSKEKTKDVIGFVIKKPDGTLSRILVENQKVIYENQSLESMFCFLDICELTEG